MRKKKLYKNSETMQKVLDAYLVHYNAKRLHQGRDMKEGTAAEVFVRCLPKPKTPKKEKMKKAAYTEPTQDWLLSGEYPICTIVQTSRGE